MWISFVRTRPGKVFVLIGVLGLSRLFVAGMYKNWKCVSLLPVFFVGDYTYTLLRISVLWRKADTVLQALSFHTFLQELNLTPQVSTGLWLD